MWSPAWSLRVLKAKSHTEVSHLEVWARLLYPHITPLILWEANLPELSRSQRVGVGMTAAQRSDGSICSRFITGNTPSTPESQPFSGGLWRVSVQNTP